MKFIFRGITVFSFEEVKLNERMARIHGNKRKYAFDIGSDAHMCSFIKADLVLMRDFLNVCIKTTEADAEVPDKEIAVD